MLTAGLPLLNRISAAGLRAKDNLLTSIYLQAHKGDVQVVVRFSDGPASIVGASEKADTL